MSSRGFIHVYTQFLYLWHTDQHNTMRPPPVLLPNKACMAVKCGTVTNIPTHRLLQYYILYSLLGRVQGLNGWSRSTWSTIGLVWYAWASQLIFLLHTNLIINAEVRTSSLQAIYPGKDHNNRPIDWHSDKIVVCTRRYISVELDKVDRGKVT